MRDKKSYQLEELLNTISHAFGIVFGLIGFFLLLKKNLDKSALAIFSSALYGISFIVLFSASTLYHYVENFELKAKLRVFDHISIYILIAGTYTPVALITLKSGNGWIIFYIVWGIAFIGSILKLFFTGKYEFISLILYLVMGWLIVFDFQNLLSRTTSLGLWLLILGGGFYTIGIIFYAWKRIPFNHFIWHLFVLGGAISHWFFIYLDVV